MSMQMELALEGGSEAAEGQRSGEAGRAAQGGERSGSECLLMEQVIARENAVEALKRVRRNKGSPGSDGMTVEELTPYLREKWSAIRQQLLAGSYQPSVVKRTLIPKSGGGLRQLGIPTVLDRFVQQLLLQVLQPIFDPTFSEHSHGFRPGFMDSPPNESGATQQWKRGRATLRELRARGLPEWLALAGAGHGRRWWWASGLAALNQALPPRYFERLGVPRLAVQTSTF